MRVEGRVVVVTGGSSGLGLSTVQYLLEKQAKVCALDISSQGCEDLLSNFKDTLFYHQCDITSEESVKKALQAVVQQFGAINAVINCAGISLPAKVVANNGEPFPLDKFKRVIEVNLNGTFNVIRLASALMIKQEPVADEVNTNERGVIINVSSIAATEGQIGQCAYSASKAGIEGLTLPAARELAKHGIRIVTIAPGIFNTPMFQKMPEKVRNNIHASVPFPKRAGEPTEFAKMIYTIIDNAYINGTTIRLDGSIRMSAM